MPWEIWRYPQAITPHGGATLLVYTASIILLGTMLSATTATGTRDVCMGELFAESCEQHQAIIMHSALYGRMSVGKCLSAEFGFLGCTNDVLFLADRWCSGRSGCQFFVPNKEFDDANEECSKDLRAYLKTSFSCVDVAHTGGYECTKGDTISLTKPHGYISSHVTDDTGCGSGVSPWRIEAAPGQVIEISLLDFSALERRGQSTPITCTDVYGYILERGLGINRTVCGMVDRQRMVYESKSNIVDVHIANAERGHHGNRFMFQYSFSGCADITPPDNTWYRRDGAEAVIGCHGNDITWGITCVGNEWMGEVGNCTDVELQLEESQWMSEFQVTLLAAVLGLAAVIAAVIIAAGVCYVRRRKRRRTRQLPHPYEGTKSGYATNPHYQPFYETKSEIKSKLKTYLPENKPQSPVSPLSDKITHIWQTPLPNAPSRLSMSSVCTCGSIASRDRHNSSKRNSNLYSGDDDVKSDLPTSGYNSPDQEYPTDDKTKVKIIG